MGTKWQEVLDRSADAMSKMINDLQVVQEVAMQRFQAILSRDSAEIGNGCQCIEEAVNKLYDLKESTRKIRASISALHRLSDLDEQSLLAPSPAQKQKEM